MEAASSPETTVTFYHTTRRHIAEYTFVNEQFPADREPYSLWRTDNEFLQLHAKANITVPSEFSATQASNLTNQVLTWSCGKNTGSSAFLQLLQFIWWSHTEATERSPMARPSPHLTSKLGHAVTLREVLGLHLGRTHRLFWLKIAVVFTGPLNSSRPLHFTQFPVTDSLTSHSMISNLSYWQSR
jgi:hypothetical protein